MNNVVFNNLFFFKVWVCFFESKINRLCIRLGVYFNNFRRRFVSIYFYFFSFLISGMEVNFFRVIRRMMMMIMGMGMGMIGIREMVEGVFCFRFCMVYLYIIFS